MTVDTMTRPACTKFMAPSDSTNVFVASNVDLVAEGVFAQLQLCGRLSLAGQGRFTQNTTRKIAESRTDVVVLDFASQGASAFVAELTAKMPALKVIGIAIGGTVLPFEHWVELGVVGFVDDNGSTDDVIAAIECVARGDYALSPTTTRALMQGVKRPRVPEAVRKLTPRETQILGDLERGASNKEIARKLGISAHTVKNHVHHVLEKLELSCRQDVGQLMRSGRP